MIEGGYIYISRPTKSLNSISEPKPKGIHEKSFSSAI